MFILSFRIWSVSQEVLCIKFKLRVFGVTLPKENYTPTWQYSYQENKQLAFIYENVCLIFSCSQLVIELKSWIPLLGEREITS